MPNRIHLPPGADREAYERGMEALRNVNPNYEEEASIRSNREWNDRLDRDKEPGGHFVDETWGVYEDGEFISAAGETRDEEFDRMFEEAGVRGRDQRQTFPTDPWKPSEEYMEDDETFDDFLAGLTQGVSFDWADEIGARARQAKDFLGGDDIRDYKTTRDELRGEYAEAAERSPWAYGGGELVGGVTTGVVPGMGLARAAKGAGKMGNVARRLTRNMNWGDYTQGGLEGYAFGVGASEEEGLGSMFSEDAAMGTAMGIGGTAVGKGIAKGIHAGAKRFLKRDPTSGSTPATRFDEEFPNAGADDFADDFGDDLTEHEMDLDFAGIEDEWNPDAGMIPVDAPSPSGYVEPGANTPEFFEELLERLERHRDSYSPEEYADIERSLRQKIQGFLDDETGTFREPPGGKRQKGARLEKGAKWKSGRRNYDADPVERPKVKWVDGKMVRHDGGLDDQIDDAFEGVFDEREWAIRNRETEHRPAKNPGNRRALKEYSPSSDEPLNAKTVTWWTNKLKSDLKKAEIELSEAEDNWRDWGLRGGGDQEIHIEELRSNVDHARQELQQLMSGDTSDIRGRVAMGWRRGQKREADGVTREESQSSMRRFLDDESGTLRSPWLRKNAGPQRREGLDLTERILSVRERLAGDPASVSTDEIEDILGKLPDDFTFGRMGVTLKKILRDRMEPDDMGTPRQEPSLEYSYVVPPPRGEGTPIPGYENDPRRFRTPETRPGEIQDPELINRMLDISEAMESPQTRSSVSIHELNMVLNAIEDAMGPAHTGAPRNMTDSLRAKLQGELDLRSSMMRGGMSPPRRSIPPNQTPTPTPDTDVPAPGESITDAVNRASEDERLAREAANAQALEENIPRRIGPHEGQAGRVGPAGALQDRMELFEDKMAELEAQMDAGVIPQEIFDRDWQKAMQGFEKAKYELRRIGTRFLRGGVSEGRGSIRRFLDDESGSFGEPPSNNPRTARDVLEREIGSYEWQLEDLRRRLDTGEVSSEEFIEEYGPLLERHRVATERLEASAGLGDDIASSTPGGTPVSGLYSDTQMRLPHARSGSIPEVDIDDPEALRRALGVEDDLGEDITDVADDYQGLTSETERLEWDEAMRGGRDVGRYDDSQLSQRDVDIREAERGGGGVQEFNLDDMDSIARALEDVDMDSDNVPTEFNDPFEIELTDEMADELELTDADIADSLSGEFSAPGANRSELETAERVIQDALDAGDIGVSEANHRLGQIRERLRQEYMAEVDPNAETVSTRSGVEGETNEMFDEARRMLAQEDPAMAEQYRRMGDDPATTDSDELFELIDENSGPRPPEARYGQQRGRGDHIAEYAAEFDTELARISNEWEDLAAAREMAGSSEQERQIQRQMSVLEAERSEMMQARTAAIQEVPSGDIDFGSDTAMDDIARALEANAGLEPEVDLPEVDMDEESITARIRRFLDEEEGSFDPSGGMDTFFEGVERDTYNKKIMDFSSMLEEAAQRGGPAAVSAMHQSLLRNPEYQEALKNMSGSRR